MKLFGPVKLEPQYQYFVIFQNHAEELKRLNIVGDTIALLAEFRKQKKNVLVEGANGTLLDIDFGLFNFFF